MDHLQILSDAVNILGERGKIYGGVDDSFSRAAQLATLKLNLEITPYMIAIILESVKDARRAADPRHADSHVDGINYRAFAAEFSGAFARPPAPPRGK